MEAYTWNGTEEEGLLIRCSETPCKTPSSYATDSARYWEEGWMFLWCYFPESGIQGGLYGHMDHTKELWSFADHAKEPKVLAFSLDLTHVFETPRRGERKKKLAWFISSNRTFHIDPFWRISNHFNSVSKKSKPTSAVWNWPPAGSSVTDFLFPKPVTLLVENKKKRYVDFEYFLSENICIFKKKKWVLYNLWQCLKQRTYLISSSQKGHTHACVHGVGFERRLRNLFFFQC